MQANSLAGSSRRQDTPDPWHSHLNLGFHLMLNGPAGTERMLHSQPASPLVPLSSDWRQTLSGASANPYTVSHTLGEASGNPFTLELPACTVRKHFSLPPFLDLSFLPCGVICTSSFDLQPLSGARSQDAFKHPQLVKLSLFKPRGQASGQVILANCGPAAKLIDR